MSTSPHSLFLVANDLESLLEMQMLDRERLVSNTNSPKGKPQEDDDDDPNYAAENKFLKKRREVLDIGS